jgi:Zn-dependent protease
VLRALGDPLSFVLLVASWIIAVTAHGYVQAVLADRAGVRGPRQEGQLSPDPRRHIDPFGAIAALIAGVGWAKPVELPPRSRRSALIAVALAGPAVNLVLGLAGLVACRVLVGPVPAASSILQYGVDGDLASEAALLFGLMNLYVAVLSLVPLPPLDGGRLLFGVGPRTAGWQKAEYHLVEQNLGVVAVLVLLLLPLGGGQALLPELLESVVTPIVRLVTGG